MVPQHPRHTIMGPLALNTSFTHLVGPLCCVVPVVWLLTGVWEAAGKHQRFPQRTHMSCTRECALGYI